MARRFAVAAVGIASAHAASPWPPSAAAAAAATLAKMSAQNKFDMLHGWGGDYVGDVPVIGPLSDGSYIPALHLHDGPQGVANGNTQVTCWPSALTVVMSWDPATMEAFGAGMGREQYLKGSNIMLGPGVNLARVPWNGRNFEYTGEDPYLASQMVSAEVHGIQSQNVSGCVKHFVFNSIEDDRSGMSSNVPNRAAKELYYRPFAAAVDAGVGSAMCSYNRINGTWACEDANSLAEIHDVMGFAGYLMSDWGATHSTSPAINNGLDQQMPDDSFFGQALVAAVAAGNVTQATIDRAVMRILTPMFALNLMEVGNSPTRNTSSPAAPPEHAILARELAEKSITLLQNDGGLLPFPAPSARYVAVFGDTDTVSGGGSGSVVRPYVVTPAQGIATYLNGPQPTPPPAVCAFDPDVDYYQPGQSGVSATGPQDCCNKCGASPTCKAWTFDPSGNSCYLKPDASGRTPHKGLTSGNLTSAPPPPSSNGTANVTYYPTQDAAAAVAASAGADLVVMVVATDSSEGSDRASLFLPPWQDAMVAALAKAGRPLVVVARCPGACHMPWSTAGPMAILYQLLPGQEAGNALANTIFGDNNPSGRLPVTFPAPPASGSGLPTDTWLSPPGGGPVMPTSYPGTDRGRGFPEADFPEDLLMGYRWYDAQGTKPEWPFGHGLSYSAFTYSNLAVVGAVSPTAAAVIYATVCNAATSPAGAEVVQLYLGYPAAAAQPPKQLKGFQKVAVGSGECAGVAFNVAASDLWVWDVVAQAWVLTPGAYTVMVGSTSADIRLTGTLTVTA